MDEAALRSLAHAKTADARLLLEAGRAANAFYLAGYAVELALKSVIARAFVAGTIPDRKFVNDIHTHDLARLLALAGLGPAMKADSDLSPALGTSWSFVLRWSEASRYADTRLDAASDLLSAIDDPSHGVLAWIARH